MDMFNSNFDPYQELIDTKIALTASQANIHALIHAHNRNNHRIDRLEKHLQEQQWRQIELENKISELQRNK